MKTAGLAGNVSTSAVIGALRYPDGSSGWVLLGMSVLSWEAPAPDGESSRFELTHLRDKVTVTFPAGREQEARAILDAVVASVVTLPDWQVRVDQRIAASQAPAPAPAPTGYDPFPRKVRDGYREMGGIDQSIDPDCMREMDLWEQERKKAAE